jgi:hypothetical protein
MTRRDIIFDLFKDIDKYKGIPPYASEPYGVYQPLLGWRSNLTKKWVQRDGTMFDPDVKRILDANTRPGPTESLPHQNGGPFPTTFIYARPLLPANQMSMVSSHQFPYFLVPFGLLSRTPLISLRKWKLPHRQEADTFFGTTLSAALLHQESSQSACHGCAQPPPSLSRTQNGNGATPLTHRQSSRGPTIMVTPLGATLGYSTAKSRSFPLVTPYSRTSRAKAGAGLTMLNP